MEITISDQCKEFFYDRLLRNVFDKFVIMNPDSTKTKNYSPILVTCQNSYLSNLFIEKVMNYIFPSEKTITSNYEHKLLNNKNISFNVKMSKNHIEVNPSEYGINDRNIVGEYIEEISNAPNIITGNKKNIIVWNIDKLGVIAFDSLHYVVKKNEDHANFICISSNSNKIDKSILSTLSEINIINPDRHFYSEFFQTYYPNLDQNSILNQLKLGLNDYNFNSFLKITEKNKITDTFIEELRTILYDLYVYHFTYDEIVYVFIEFVANDPAISDEKKRLILKKACLYGTTSSKGNKQVIHLEAFIYNCMNIYHSAAKA
jgi:hypothetical protein